MKNIFKIFILAFSLVIFNGCNSDDDGARFSVEETSGWIQFKSATTDVTIDNFDTSTPLNIEFLVKVPVTPNDIKVTYKLVGVSGQDPNQVFTSSNVVLLPAETYGYANVGLNPSVSLNLGNAVITEKMVFDVVLVSTDNPNVTVGIAGSARPTSNRVTICPSLNSSTGAFLGDYILTVPSGDGPFGTVFADGITVTLVEGENGPFSRVFQADYLPGIAAGLPVIDIPFEFVNGKIKIGSNILTGVGCGGGQIMLGGDSGNILSQPCGDDMIQLNLMDFVAGSGGCGAADVPVTVVLTKA